MKQVFIGLGSNIGERLENLRAAVQHLAALPETKVMKVSGVYESEPLGFTEQENFFNAVCELETALQPEDLFLRLKQIEHLMGRPEQYERWHPRVIDLDILLYGSRIVETPMLTVPHAEMHDRKFVLVPLSELADPVHPKFQKPVSQLLGETSDTSMLTRRQILNIDGTNGRNT
ncbi:MAG: 2-amino-4-hydroxy-6-hydroxymethyldihydropteridine diphosphokinase [Rhizobacter sp.]|nr:2-amino-4-hydroxy-6-hydroxymethyldihydropteridine diphosphokinase [Chlorobiales bacterium]